MENHKLVLPEHLNQFGFLFGGNLLKWLDEYARIAASLDFPGCNFVTIGMDRVVFRKTVREGTILKFIVENSGTGNTSVRYRVHVFNGNSVKVEKQLIFATHVTLVRVDEQGRKTTLPKP
jgi:acyl-CoA hydrolase